MEEKEYKLIDWQEQILEKFDADEIHNEWYDSYDWQYDDWMPITQSQCEMIERILSDESYELSKRQVDVLNRVLHEGKYRERDRMILNKIRKHYLEGVKITSKKLSK